MEKLICLEDYKETTKSKLSELIWYYITNGAGLGRTAIDNVEAYKRYRILPRVLCDISQLDTSTTLLGEKITFPLGATPTALNCLCHPDGELAVSKGCMKAGVSMSVSQSSTKSIEEITTHCEGKGLRWMQIQPLRDRSMTADLVQRATNCGYKALVVTCDHPEMGIKYYRAKNEVNDILSGQKPHYLGEEVIRHHGNIILDPKQSWEWVDWLRSITSLPIVLKGIMTVEDAREALKHDIQAIQVSNHGGRHFDGAPATIDVLPDIVREVNGKVEVYIDGGIRHGTDIFKALALGARAVFVGRPLLWGLACNGEDGVSHVLHLLKEEFRSAMVFTGCTNVTDITSDFIRHTSYYYIRSLL